MSLSLKPLIRMTALTTALVIAGCGYSDYPGHPGHKTDKEAYVPAWSTVVAGFGDEYDGTYVYSVNYNNRNWQKNNFKFNVEIIAYRNKVTDSYPHRPNVFPDADGFEGATGFAGGEYEKYWIANDQDAIAEGGYDNFDQSLPLDDDGNWIEPALVLVVSEPEQEVDRFDWDLQSNIKSASQLLNQLLLDGDKMKNLTVTISGLEINGQMHQVAGFDLGVSAQGSGQHQLKLVNQPSAKDLLNKIIANTEHLKPVKLKVHLTNGLTVPLPKGLSVSFNHNVLKKFVK